jgi:hypothetical protein
LLPHPLLLLMMCLGLPGLLPELLGLLLVLLLRRCSWWRGSLRAVVVVVVLLLLLLPPVQTCRHRCCCACCRPWAWACSSEDAARSVACGESNNLSVWVGRQLTGNLKT